jgi:hypothetical protein
MADGLDNEQIAWELRDRERAAQQAAFEAQMHANRAQVNPGFGGAAAMASQWMQAPTANAAAEHAARANFAHQQASDDSAYAARAQSGAQEANLMKHEARRRAFETETGRYDAETRRTDTKNQHAARMGQVGALNNMTASMGSMGFGAGGGAPGINLYGAGGQRIGGSGVARSPLSSLLD